MDHRPVLGILGGLGPASSAYFYELICSHTLAGCDQEHIDIILSSRASTPDRTAYILGKSADSPLESMVRDAKMLESCGASAIVIPCNTAHYFIDEVRRTVSVPVPSIITETLLHIRSCGKSKVGLMATEGTVYSASYQNECERLGLSCITPDQNTQTILTDIIYNSVKSGKDVEPERLYAASEFYTSHGCETVILGCTELSIVYRKIGYDPLFTDSLEVLACTAIKLCGHTLCGFPPEFNS